LWTESTKLGTSGGDGSTNNKSDKGKEYISDDEDLIGFNVSEIEEEETPRGER